MSVEHDTPTIRFPWVNKKEKGIIWNSQTVSNTGWISAVKQAKAMVVKKLCPNPVYRVIKAKKGRGAELLFG